jgi:hypothetical protein
MSVSDKAIQPIFPHPRNLFAWQARPSPPQPRRQPLPTNQQRKERTYEGESRAGKLQEALDQALGTLSAELGAGGVADGLASWKLADITGQLGGFAGFHTVKVKIKATRSPDWPQ